MKWKNLKKLIWYFLSYFLTMFLVMLIDRFVLLGKYDHGSSYYITDELIYSPGNMAAVSIFFYFLVLFIIEKPCWNVYKNFLHLKLKPVLISLAAGIGIQLISGLFFLIFKMDNTDTQIGLACFLAPFAEEIFFREMIYDLFSEKAAIIISSILFALCHFNPCHLVIYLIFGFMLAFIRKKWNVVYCIIAHLMANAIAFAVPFFS